MIFPQLFQRLCDYSCLSQVRIPGWPCERDSREVGAGMEWSREYIDVSWSYLPTSWRASSLVLCLRVRDLLVLLPLYPREGDKSPLYHIQP